MQRYKGIIAYDGSGFSGFQIQPNGRTVQGELEKSLAKMHKGKEVSVVASGRTDAGVHARGQVVHFDSSLQLSSERWVRALNGLLPSDISFMEVVAAPSSFHARFDASGKQYKYIVYTSSVRDPFKLHYAAFHPYRLDMSKVKKAAEFLVGTHDYTSFCSAKTNMDNKVRTVSSIEIEQNAEEIVFTFTGNGFLYNMVRIIVGTLLAVGAGKIDLDRVPVILAGRDRILAGKTAPAEGLYLWEVYY
ncbi:tRNA pseudouridine(38-40) synthase TruA [Bacillus sp. FJAT-49711]|uniref:tRNA pseudouridine(38-40) synthase TruA n=1 Tax=Bacillus sp. FJAT-49711 TaxID=2833585 RepID=UPI001BC94AC1|nr:tRNA pseudouridine(38-40) synthase TruA [Bacillus sp. FJAT-49711]MBS4220997.1 tRNA pseudouridine(38-40) synthase TruA [Bacillus sp. FJAT-49711]